MNGTKAEPKIVGKYRRTGKGPVIEELRVTVVEFNGNKYLDLRMWELGRNHQWFPTVRGVRFRQYECDDLADVIAKGGKLLASENAARRRGPAVVVESKGAEPSSVATDRAVPPWEPIPA